MLELVKAMQGMTLGHASFGGAGSDQVAGQAAGVGLVTSTGKCCTFPRIDGNGGRRWTICQSAWRRWTGFWGGLSRTLRALFRLMRFLTVNCPISRPSLVRRNQATSLMWSVFFGKLPGSSERRSDNRCVGLLRQSNEARRKMARVRWRQRDRTPSRQQTQRCASNVENHILATQFDLRDVLIHVVASGARALNDAFGRLLDGENRASAAGGDRHAAAPKKSAGASSTPSSLAKSRICC